MQRALPCQGINCEAIGRDLVLPRPALAGWLAGINLFINYSYICNFHQ